MPPVPVDAVVVVVVAVVVVLVVAPEVAPVAVDVVCDPEVLVVPPEPVAVVVPDPEQPMSKTEEARKEGARWAKEAFMSLPSFQAERVLASPLA